MEVIKTGLAAFGMDKYFMRLSSAQIPNLNSQK